MFKFKTKIIIIRKKQILKYSLILIFFISSMLTIKPTVENVFNNKIRKEIKPAKKNLPIYCVNTESNKISISFDAAWGADDTDTLLKILKNNNVKTTFFICGYWIDKYPEIVKKIYNEGHEIGNHSNTHPHVSKISLENNKEEIQKAHDKIKKLLGIDMILYRPPFGEYNNTVLQAAKELNYHVIQWNIDSLDWKNKGPDHEINQVINNKKLSKGSIILFHNDAKFTPEVLDFIIKALKEKGYEIVPISKLIHKENYFMNNEGRQFKK